MRDHQQPGLEHVLEYHPYLKSHVPFFQRRDVDGVVWRSPVSFTVPGQETTGLDELPIEDARLGIGESRIVDVGTNGWIVAQGFECKEGEPIMEGTNT